jgi:hypothetical protein
MTPPIQRSEIKQAVRASYFIPISLCKVQGQRPGSITALSIMKNLISITRIYVCRWGNLPITEAKTFGHQKVVDYLKLWEATHKEQLEEAELASQESVPLPQ